VRALVLDPAPPGHLRFTADHPEPEAAPGEARVRVARAGICATDFGLKAGYMGFSGVPGHEFVGVVEDAPDPAWVGRRVVGEINAACGRCDTCRAGRPRHCPHRTVLGIQGRDGAFAERLVLPLGNLHPVPDGVPDEAAVFVEPLAAAFRVVEQVPVDADTRALVLGDGRLGLLIAQVLHRAGCRVTLVGRHPDKRALAEGWGVATAPAEADPDAADIVVEATGRPEGLARAIALTRPLGTVVLKTTCAEAVRFQPAPIVIHELTVVGSRCGPFAPALAALAAGTVDVAPLVAATFPLEEGERAFARAAAPGTLKVLLAP